MCAFLLAWHIFGAETLCTERYYYFCPTKEISAYEVAVILQYSQEGSQLSKDHPNIFKKYIHKEDDCGKEGSR